MPSGFLQDLRTGARLLARSPGFTLIAVLSLAIGIGANTATFSFADGLLLRPLPVPDASEVVTVGSVNVATGGTDVLRVSYPDYVDLRDATASFAGGLVAFEDIGVQFAASPDATPEVRTATLVSGNFFSVMGVQPAFGRAFGSAEDAVPGRDAVAVLSYRFWQRALAADPSVLGRRVRVNGIEFTVVGVAPESFTGLDLFVRPDVYVPLMMWPALVGDDQPSPLEQRDRRALDLKGRLTDGVTPQQAGADVARIGAALAEEYPATNRGFELLVRTEIENRLLENEFLVPTIGMLTVLGALILVVACVNVAGLLTSRAPAREGEIAVRLSIGAGRARIVRQLLTESALLALGGAFAGAAFGYLGMLLWRQIPVEDELAIELLFDMNQRVLLVNLAVAAASVFVFGLTPALRASRASLTNVLRTSGSGLAGRTGWGRGALVAIQIALSVVFISVTAFIYDSFLDLAAAGPGVRTEGVLIMSFNTELARYGPDEAERFYERLADEARGAAGVEAVSLASFIPLSGLPVGQTAIAPEGHEFPAGIESESVLTSYVDAGFFGLMDVPVTQGRAFATTDTAEAPRVAVVNQRARGSVLARREPRRATLPFERRRGTVGRDRRRGPDGTLLHHLGSAVRLHVFAVRAKPAEPDGARHALEPRPAHAGRAAPRSRARARPESCGGGRSHDGVALLRVGRAELHGSHFRDRCDGCDERDARLRRHLWSRGVERQPAHARDRAAHGRRGGPEPSAPDGARPRRSRDADRLDLRAPIDVRRRPGAASRLSRRERRRGPRAHRIRARDLGDAPRHGARGVSARAPRGAHRADAGAALRVTALALNTRFHISFLDGAYVIGPPPRLIAHT